MKTITIESRISGRILFEHTQEDNTHELTLRAAFTAGANLRGADLSNASLSGASLSGASLSGADLCGADLRGADLCDADLSNASLSGADLSNASLSGADLRSANLRGADLCDADLCGADLFNADLSGADLSGADLCDAGVDFSRGWTFACRHSRFKINVSFARQVLAHLCSCTSDDAEFTGIKELILPEAKKSHRAGDLGLLD